MNGPFEISRHTATVVDTDGNRVATGDGPDEEAEGVNAQMVCDALNAVFYATRAAGASES